MSVFVVLPPKHEGAHVRWERPRLPLTNGSDNRSPEAWLRVLSTFQIDDPFYLPEGTLTWCNIFIWHWSIAMSVEIPHWIKGRETRANDLHDWLLGKLVGGGPMQGPQLGWRECTELEARAHANAGRPVVAAWKNPNGPGHIAAVRPHPGDVTMLAQAGRQNSLSIEYRKVFTGGPNRFFFND
jgi:hypothetical protein